jgi:hypothetical protein
MKFLLLCVLTCGIIIYVMYLLLRKSNINIIPVKKKYTVDFIILDEVVSFDNVKTLQGHPVSEGFTVCVQTFSSADGMYMVTNNSLVRIAALESGMTIHVTCGAHANTSYTVQ